VNLAFGMISHLLADAHSRALARAGVDNHFEPHSARDNHNWRKSSYAIPHICDMSANLFERFLCEIVFKVHGKAYRPCWHWQD
jgi:hypothetical protein